MSVPDADTLIRLAEILEVSVSELLGTKIENENVASDVAEQLSRINEQLAIKNRRSRRIWKIVAIILAVIVLVNIFIAVFFSVPDLNSNTQNNPLAISDETISIDESATTMPSPFATPLTLPNGESAINLLLALVTLWPLKPTVPAEPTLTRFWRIP